MFYYERLTAVSSVPEKIVRYREVSTRRKGGSVSFYSRLIGGGVCYLFILVSHLGIHQLPTKHPREKVLEPRNIYEKKFWTHKIPTRKNLEPTKFTQEKILNPRNAHEKSFRIHEITTRKNFGSTKYPREKRFGHTRCVPEKILEPRKHDGTMARDSRDPHGTRSTEFSILD